MKTMTVKLEGLRCESCAQTIKAVVGAEDGKDALIRLLTVQGAQDEIRDAQD